MTGVFLQAAIVLAVIVRVRDKESRFGRVLMLIYLILLAVGVIAFIVLFVILCKIMSDCCSSCQNMPG